jgi:RNA polymerase sigma-B factor
MIGHREREGDGRWQPRAPRLASARGERPWFPAGEAMRRKNSGMERELLLSAIGERAVTDAASRAGTRRATMWGRGRIGDEEALLERWEPLARHLAYRFLGVGEREDLEQVARLALLHAWRQFDPARGCRFETYAAHTILGHLRHHTRDREPAIRVPRRWWELYRPMQRLRDYLTQLAGREPTAAELAARLGVSEADVVGALGYHEFSRPKQIGESWGEPEDGEAAPLQARLGQPDPRLEAVEQRVALQQILMRLPERLRHILQQRFLHGRTQTEIAGDLGLSQMQICRLEKQALAQLREELQGPTHGWP